MEQLKKIEGYTPGPWHLSVPKSLGRWAGFNTNGGKCVGVYATGDDLEAIAQIRKDEMLIQGEQNHLANASLIAYAPELYELACKQEERIRELSEALEGLVLEYEKTCDEAATKIGVHLDWTEFQTMFPESPYNKGKELLTNTERI